MVSVASVILESMASLSGDSAEFRDEHMAAVVYSRPVGNVGVSQGASSPELELGAPAPIAGDAAAQCPSCGGAASPAFAARDRNRRHSGREFFYLGCARCGWLFLRDVPDDLGRYYVEEYDVLPTMEELRGYAVTESYRLDFVRPWVHEGRLLDVGACRGVFAHLASQAGFDVQAIEMDSRCCEYLRHIVGVETIETGDPERVLAQLPPTDVITLWHVIEHLVRPSECLAAAAENLAPGGILVVATPNPDSLQLKLMRSRWPHIDAPRHLHLIPPATLVTRMRSDGLELVRLTMSDVGGRRWNRFGWQRLLINTASSRQVRRAATVAGSAIAVLVDPLERRAARGSTYTAVFRKPEPT